MSVMMNLIGSIVGNNNGNGNGNSSKTIEASETIRKVRVRRNGDHQ
jgi:hypothetical protein